MRFPASQNYGRSQSPYQALAEAYLASYEVQILVSLWLSGPVPANFSDFEKYL